ncbi:MAG: glycosyltransferase, partial [Gammaproteobacteria bacterium]|nr:glycosyltransferase [Gammaproteobacteria bacterium]
MAELDILIPSRNELFLARTIQDILEQSESDIGVIAVLDGAPADPPVPDDPRVTIIYHQESVGQRAATNDAARLSSAKYVMKVDAHCSFDKGFDRIMIADMQDDWTMVPIMRNLHAFDWVCKKCGDRRYQGPTPTECPKCDNTTEFERDMKWIGKHNPQSTSFCFDSEPHFQYFKEFSKRPEGKGDITPTMSLQGSCFMLTREKYWELDICGEEFGSWGSQGIEVALKTWLSGGQVMVNHKTWYAHMFRTQGGDFSFPYHLSSSQVKHAKKTAREMFWNRKWAGQKYTVSSLVEKFWPVQGWTDEDLAALKKDEAKGESLERFAVVTDSGDNTVVNTGPTKGIVYYTDNRLDPEIMAACQRQISKSGLPIVSVSLKPIDFGENIVLDLERGA